LRPGGVRRALVTAAGLAGVAVLAACGSSTAPTPAPPSAPAPVASEGPSAPAEASAPADVSDEREAQQIEAITRAVNDRAGQIQACYKRATAQRLDVDGRVILELTLGEQGRVASVRPETDEPGSAQLASCLVGLYEAHQFPPIFDPGDTILLPLSFVAAFEQYTVARAHVHPNEAVPGIVATVMLDGDSTGNEAASMTHLDLAPGTDVPLHTHTSAELLYFGAGGGRVWGVRGAKRGEDVAADTAVYVAPGVPHALRVGDQGARVLQLYAPGGPEQRFEGREAPGNAAVSEAERRKLARKRGVGQPLVAALKDAPVYPIAGGKASVAFLFDPRTTGDGGAYLGAMTIQSGTRVPEHTHDRSTELLYVLEGTGSMTVGDQSYDVGPAMAIQVPAFRRHSFTASSDVRILQYYAPAGPENRFRPKAD